MTNILEELYPGINLKKEETEETQETPVPPPVTSEFDVQPRVAEVDRNKEELQSFLNEFGSMDAAQIEQDAKDEELAAEAKKVKKPNFIESLTSTGQPFTSVGTLAKLADYALNREKFRKQTLTELAEDKGGVYDPESTATSQYIDADVSSMFALNNEQLIEAVKLGIQPMPDGSPRNFVVIEDPNANPFFFDSSIVVSVMDDNGKMTPFAPFKQGLTDWAKGIGPYLAVELGLSAATITTATAGGLATASVFPPAAPFVALALLYSGGVAMEKTRNEIAETLGIKPEDEKGLNDWAENFKQIITAPAVILPGEKEALPGFLGAPLTDEEKLSGAIEALFNIIPAKNMFGYARRKSVDNFKNLYGKMDIKDSTFKSAARANEFRKKFGLGKLIPSQVSSNKILNRIVNLADQVTNIVAYQFREQNRGLIELMQGIRSGDIVIGGDIKGGGVMAQFQKEFAKFSDEMAKVAADLDVSKAGQINAEMFILFRQLRKFNAEGLYAEAHAEIGSAPMNMTNIVEHIRKNRTKIVVPTTDPSMTDLFKNVKKRDKRFKKGFREELAVDAEGNKIKIGTSPLDVNKNIQVEEYIASDIDTMLNAMVEQLNKLGVVQKTGNLKGSRILNQKQIDRALEIFSNEAQDLSDVAKSYYNTPAKLLHLYSSKLGDMQEQIILAHMKTAGEGMSSQTQQRLGAIRKLQVIIQDTIKNPILPEGSDAQRIKFVDKLTQANKFYSDSQDLIGQEEILGQLAKATAPIGKGELGPFAEAIVGKQAATPPGSVPIQSLRDVAEIEAFVNANIDRFIKAKNQNLSQQTDEAFTIKGKTRATKGKDLGIQDTQGLQALRTAFNQMISFKLAKMGTADISVKGAPTELSTYLESFSPEAKRILGLTTDNELLLKKQASELAQLDNTVASNLAGAADTTPMYKAIGEIFDNPGSIEGGARSLKSVVERQPDGFSRIKSKKNIERALVDYVFSKDSGVMMEVAKNSAYAEKGDLTVNPERLMYIISQIKESPTLSEFVNPKLVTVLDGMADYAVVTKTVGVDAGSALSGAQLISNVYTLDPRKFINTVSKLYTQRRVAKVLTKGAVTEALFASMQKAQGGADALAELISTDKFIGSVLLSAAQQSDRESDVFNQTDQVLKNQRYHETLLDLYPGLNTVN